MRIRKHPFTLLEVLISLSLATIVISALLYFYMQTTAINEKITRIEQEAFKIRYLQSRLNYLLSYVVVPKTKSDNTAKTSDKILFYTASDDLGLFEPTSSSLVFKTDFKASCDEFLACDIIVRLFLDRQGRLTAIFWQEFSKWPSGGIPRIHKEVLMENVSSLKFSFYISPDVVKAQKDKNEELKAHEMDWIGNWKVDYQTIPAIVKMTITQKGGQEMPFYFPLMDLHKMVEYKK